MKKVYLFSIKALVMVFSVLALAFIVAPKAQATVTPSCANPCPYPIAPSQLPLYIDSYFQKADTYSQTPAIATWISPAANYSTISIDVPANTTTLSLSLNTAGVIGFSSSGWATSYNQIVAATPQDTNLPVNSPKGFYLNNTVGTYGSLQYSFNYTPPGGFKEGNYTINVPYKAVNTFNDGVQQCVVTSGRGQTFTGSAVASNAWQTQCPTYNVSVTFSIHITANQLDSLGAITCTSRDSGTQNENNYFTGYAVYVKEQNVAPTVTIYEQNPFTGEFNIPRQTFTANQNNQDIYNFLSPVYIGMNSSTNYSFNVKLADVFHDGQNHVLKAVLNVKENYPEFGNYFQFLTSNSAPNPFTVGPSNENCGVAKWAYPWLQTQNGNVIANGHVYGQNIQGEWNNYIGGRAFDSADREAEFMIISTLGGGFPFCSNYNYILTNVASQFYSDPKIPFNYKCTNGDGYSSLNNFKLNSDSGNDLIYQGANKIFSSLGSNCAKTNLPATINVAENPSVGIDTICSQAAAMYKISANSSIGNFNVKQGRATILVDGDLYITGDIKYQPSTSITKLNNYPSLGIIVNGSIYIDKSVSQIDALLYSKGKIDTCAYSSSSGALSYGPQDCYSQLIVNGALLANSGFRFGRSYFLPTAETEPRPPAEKIIATPQSILYAPLGMDFSSYTGSNDSYFIDYSEYQPKYSE